MDLIKQQKKLELAIINNSKNVDKVLNNFIKSFAVLYSEDGKIVRSTLNSHIYFVVHERVSDVFVPSKYLGQFVSDLESHIPKNTSLDHINIFGISKKQFIDSIIFLTNILYLKGYKEINYFYYDNEIGQYLDLNAIDCMLETANLIKDPHKYKEMLKACENNGVYDIKDLAYLLTLKRIAKAI